MASLKRGAPDAQIFDYDRIRRMAPHAVSEAVLDYIRMNYENNILVAEMLVQIQEDYPLRLVVKMTCDQDLNLLLGVLNAIPHLPEIDPVYDCRLESPAGLNFRGDPWRKVIENNEIAKIVLFRTVLLNEQFDDCIKWIDALLSDGSPISSPQIVVDMLIQLYKGYVTADATAINLAAKLIRYICLMPFMTNSMVRGPRSFSVDERGGFDAFGRNMSNIKERASILLNLLKIEDVETFVVCMNNLFDSSEWSLVQTEATNLLQRAIRYDMINDSLTARILDHVFASKTSKAYRWIKETEEKENYWRFGTTFLQHAGPLAAKSFLKHFSATVMRTKDFNVRKIHPQTSLIFEKEHCIVSLAQGIPFIYRYGDGLKQSIEQTVKELIKKNLAKVIIVKIILSEFAMIYSDTTLQKAWESMITDLVTKETKKANSLTDRMEEMKISDDSYQRPTRGTSRRGIL